jgi:uncharacterized cupredoxin-like copper-binding protein
MRGFRVAVVAALALLVAATATAFAAFGASSSGATVKVTLKEMKVVSATKTVPAGKVTFMIRNAGSVEHEFVVLRFSGGRLPVKHFKAAENEPDVIGEAEDIEPGKTARLRLTLKPGRYLLFCNIAGHYQLGMARVLRVT